MSEPDAKPKRRWWRLLRWTSAILLTLCVLLFPLPVRDSDREYVITRDAINLRDVNPVFVNWSRQPFYDAGLIARQQPQWHLYSDIDLDLTALEESGFHRMTEAEKSGLVWGEWYEKGNVLLKTTDQTAWPEDAEPGLRFNVLHGTMAAQGYVVYIHRCLLGTFAHYEIEWVS